MIRPSNVRTITLLSALLLAVLVAACSSGGGNANSANATVSNNSNVAIAVNNTPNANANQASAGNTAKGKLNLNTASGSDFLAAIPGMGNRMVHEFEEYRPYKSIQQFRREIGKYVSAAQVSDYEKYVYVPINRNESDAATLQQIPGLDEKEAQALIAARPFASNDAFLAKLAASVSEEELAVAKTYLSNK
jgi:DNA uptake protein ComE-like DNA-binding protein